MELEKKPEIMLGIIGGMGPKASLLLHELLLSRLAHYKKISTDQDFLNLIHFSFSASIPDRKGYLLGEGSVNPVEEIMKQIRYLDFIARARDTQMVVGIPCNTFHAQPIYKTFQESLDPLSVRRIHCVHLIEATVKVLQKQVPPGTRVGILSTTGEWSLKIYDEPLIRRGLKPVRSDESLQKSIQDCIYNKEWGLKTASSDYTKNLEEIQKIVTLYKKEKGIEALIWGCTEFSLISESFCHPALVFVDSTRALADCMIIEALENTGVNWGERCLV